MASQSKHIVVIGAGVTGLQTSISLLEAGYQVTIVAKHFPGDKSIEYTSPWAGAQWRTHAPNSDKEQQEWDILSYKKWSERIELEQEDPSVPKSGLGFYPSEFFTLDQSTPWFAQHVTDFKMTGHRTIAGTKYVSQAYLSIDINVPMYLEYLLTTAISLGAVTHKTALPLSSSLAGTLRYTADIVKNNVRATPIAAFVNATGLGARLLVPDDTMFPVRGQTITVKGEAKIIRTVDAKADSLASAPSPSGPMVIYVIPRPHSGTTIIGGTKQVGSWDTSVNTQTSKHILERAREFAPELLDERGEFEVVSEQVGFRPGRKGGARVEIEELRLPGGLGDAVTVCHAYGHAGAGYQNSLGSAGKVVRLFGEYFGKKTVSASRL